MDFNSLMAKMRELDQPAPTIEASATECGEPMMGGIPPSMSDKPDTPPPSMSVNLNAQGLDDIAELMKLMTKVNPDMINQPAPVDMPSISPEPSISSIGDLGNLDAGPLKMLPLDDIENDMSEPGDDAMNPGDGVSVAQGDIDNDGDHDMDDHKAEKEKEEGFGNTPDGASDQEYYGHDSAVPSGDDLHKSKNTFPKVNGGDNPMKRMESKDELRASVKAELSRRLEEAKMKQAS